MMKGLANARADPFLDVYIKLSIVVMTFSLLSPDFYISLIRPIAFAIALVWFVKSFGGLLSISYFIVTLYAMRYFRRRNFDKKVFIIPYTYLGMIVLLLALATIGMMTSLVWNRSLPQSLAAPLLILETVVEAFLLFFAVWLRKKISFSSIKAIAARQIIVRVVVILLLAAVIFTLSLTTTKIAEPRKISVAYASIGILSLAVQIAAIWYSVWRIKQLRVTNSMS